MNSRSEALLCRITSDGAPPSAWFASSRRISSTGYARGPSSSPFPATLSAFPSPRNRRPRRHTASVYIEKKVALLIGINYDRPEEVEEKVRKSYGELKKPRRDIENLRDFLVEKCDYHESDIVVMMDGLGDSDATLTPTKDNIRRQIMKLVKGAKSGDHLLFVFAGHSDQIPNKTGSEDDGQDEELIALNGGLIDNELYKLLVEPLPATAHLTAIFDTCHSGTMLDLKHYNCNRIWVPWISKGFRNTEISSRCIVLTRKNARCDINLTDIAELRSVVSDLPFQPRRLGRAATLNACERFPRTETYASIVHVAVVTRSKTESELEPKRKAWLANLFKKLHRTSGATAGKGKEKEKEGEKGTEGEKMGKTVRALDALALGTLVLSTNDANKAFAQAMQWTMEPLTEEPENLVKQCDGFCTPLGESDEDATASSVVSLAACNDDQQAWDSKRGSLIPMLMDFLRINPAPSFRQLLAELSYQTHINTLKLHKKGKELHEEACEKAKERGERHQDHKPLEHVNFQDIVLGSEKKLNLDAKFTL